MTEAFSVPSHSVSIVATAARDTSLATSRVTADSIDRGAVESPAAVLGASAAHPADLPGRVSSVVAPSRVPLSTLAELSGTPLLSQLGLVPSRTLDAYLSAHPETVAGLLAAPPAAADVSVWWASLTPKAQGALRSASSELVGNLDGIPATARNEANQLWLGESITALESAVASNPARSVQSESTKTIHMLTEVKTALGTAHSVPQRSLLTVDDEGSGRAAIVLGDLDTADFVTYLVPGMFFTVDGQIGDWTDDAARIYDEQVSWLSLLGESDSDYSAKTVAVVAWMGYETPDLTSIATLDLAERGADVLASAIDGLKADRSADPPYISIVAHSYGSTTALISLSKYALDIDALTVIGSPGSAVTSVDELSVRDGNVFVGEAAWDPVPNTAYFGRDPGAAGFGAKHMNVGGGLDLITNEILGASVGHNGYFSAGSESVRNLALIGIGQGQLVTDGSAEDRDRTLALVE